MPNASAAVIRRRHDPDKTQPWHLVERYVESYVAGDFRCIFRRGDEVLEVSVPEEVWRAFDA